MNFKKEFRKYQDIINEELNKYNIKEDCYEKKLNDSIEYSLMAGGKRIRPILIIASYMLFKENIEEVMPFAIAIEMVHNFSLIHDDLPEIDNDDFRHGKETNHKKFGHGTALLAGDALLNKAYDVIGEELVYSSENEYKSITKNKIRAFSEFAKATDRMIAGEFVDTELEGREIEKDVLEYIHINKTGALLRMCARIGAIVANATENDIALVSRYAEKIGLAFQIKDDILSEEGDSKITGKPVGNDKAMKKCTYVSVYGLEGAKEQLNNTINEAINIISKFGDKADFLSELALYIMNREK